jgi:hypothetical protein
MPVDRYVKIVLTVIAIELFWIGVRDVAPPVSAQAQALAPVAAAAPTAVVIRGIDIEGQDLGVLPVVAARPLRVDDSRGLTVRGTVTVQADRPLPVESVPYAPARRPGE